MDKLDYWKNKKEAFTEDEEEILNELGLLGESRRKFIGQVSAASLSIWASSFFTNKLFAAENELPPIPGYYLNTIQVALHINNKVQKLDVDSRTTLLDALREHLNLTGSKKGCDHGQCGACTVIIDGKRKLSCLTLAATCENKKVVTVEGLANGNQLHPMQEAFLEHDGFQCGYCTSGQICSSVALLEEAKQGEASYVSKDVKSTSKNVILSEEEIRERMSGNLCRCGAYNNIVQAIQEVQSGAAHKPRWEFATLEQLKEAGSSEN